MAAAKDSATRSEARGRAVRGVIVRSQNLELFRRRRARVSQARDSNYLANSLRAYPPSVPAKSPNRSMIRPALIFDGPFTRKPACLTVPFTMHVTMPAPLAPPDALEPETAR